MEKFSNKKVIDLLSSEYPDIQFIIEDVNLIGRLSVIAGLFNTEKLLKNYWEDISSSVCTHYQMNIENDFTKWNTYLIYVCKELVDKELKYQIENDKFSNRKIVVQNFSIGFNGGYINELISNKISLDKLLLTHDKDEVKPVKFEAQSFLSKTILSLETDAERELSSLEEALNIIENHFKNENN